MYWAIYAAVVVAFAVALYARHRVLRGYDEPPPLEPTRRVHSPTEWRSRCEASLAASRKRRNQ
jgi:hypothetical protein